MSKSNKKSSRRKPQAAKQKFNWIWIAVGLAVVVVVTIAAFALRPASTPTVDAANLPAEISVDEASQLYPDGAFFLDVREIDEWNEYHAPDSTLIPLGELASRVDEVPRDRPVVVVCRSGNRSQVGRDTLLDAGFTNVTSMAGGLKTWQAAGYPTVSSP